METIVPDKIDNGVQPGWIYVRKFNRFFCPKTPTSAEDIESGSVSARVSEISLKAANYIFQANSFEKYWEEDMIKKDLNEECKLLVLSMTQVKELGPKYKVKNCNYEYVSQVTYGYAFSFLITHERSDESVVNNFIEVINGLLCNSDNRPDFMSDLHGISKVKIYYDNEINYGPLEAVQEIIRIKEKICYDNHMVSTLCIIKKLFNQSINKSNKMCTMNLLALEPPKTSWNVYKIFTFPLSLFHSLSPKGKGNLEKSKSTKDLPENLCYLVNDMERKSKEINNAAKKEDYPSTKEVSLINKDPKRNKTEISSLHRNSQNETSKIGLNCNPQNKKTTIGSNAASATKATKSTKCGLSDQVVKVHYEKENAIAHKLPSLNRNSQNETSKIGLNCNPQNKKITIGSNAVSATKETKNQQCGRSDQGVIKVHNEKENTIAHKLPSSHQNLAPDVTFTDNLRTTIDDYDAKSSMAFKEFPPQISESKNKTKKIKKDIPILRIHSPDKVTQDDKFKCLTFLGGNDVPLDGKCMLLIGAKCSEKSSFINLVWQYLCEERQTTFLPVINIDSKEENVIIYKFLGIESVGVDLTIIDTPNLSDETLEYVKSVILEENLVIHGLALVLSAHNHELPPVHRNLISFIRSSFGEVSNHHLVAIITHCDLERTFPALEETKTLGMRPQHVFTINNIPVDSKSENDLNKAINKMNFRKVKKCLKTLKSFTRISVKATKLAQEKSFAAAHSENVESSLTDEMMKFVTILEKELFHDNFRPMIKKIWPLMKLVFSMNEDEASEKKLIGFASKMISKLQVSDDVKNKAFLYIILLDSENSISVGLKEILNFHTELFGLFNIQQNNSKMVDVILPESQEVGLYCNSCKDIHLAKRIHECYGIHLQFECTKCKCDPNCHSLWSNNNSNEIVLSFANQCRSLVKNLFENLPEIDLQLSEREFINAVIESSDENYELLLNYMYK